MVFNGINMVYYFEINEYLGNDMIQLLNPKTISAPNGTYSHGVLVTGASKFLVISGQVAIKSDGTIPDALLEQCEVIWGNILAILEESSMSIKNLIKINSYFNYFTY